MTKCGGTKGWEAGQAIGARGQGCATPVSGKRRMFLPGDALHRPLEVHQKGKSIIQGGLSKEIAETKVNRTVQFFRAQGYPLLATCEREE